MEQLPPKAPITMAAHNWPSFPFQTPAASPWMDEFLDFSATRRSSHRRTVSDPIAFVEEGGMDEQLRNMFSDDLITALGSSDDDDDKRTVACLQPKAETEVDSSDQPPPDPTAPGDPKRIKR